MGIYEALNQLTWKKKEYFLWKFNLNVRVKGKTEEEICKTLNVKSLDYMKKWEKSPEYLALVNLYIESKTATDLEKIYKVVSEKAIEGDEKSIKLLLDLQKQVRSFNQSSKPVQTSNSYDELEL
ncbi:hypothetical protein MKX47_11785 [Solibacillus sp. FSL R7-0668]|uniref:hypothetical protein n=1 Tax=Solibacillus sp. FSL R7-0668 TaxID=2921688 RepID=UPI0030FC5C3E